MRLREMTFRQQSRWELGDRLIAAGYKKIGQGSHARVYARPNDPFVLKIVSNHDEAFLAFYEMTLRYPSPHWPRWRSKLMRINELWGAIRMERLEEVETNPETNQTFDDAYQWLLRGGMEEPESFQSIFNSGDDEHDWRLERQEREAALARVNANKPLQAALMHLSELTQGRKARLDINIGNVMRRGNVLVFVDPVAPVAPRINY